MFGLHGQQGVIASALIVVMTTFVAGMMSGLTLALFSLDETFLRVTALSGTRDQRTHAARLIRLVESPHWLLVTLLLCNAAAVELMPLALDTLVSPAVAIVLSVTLVLLFGEIIPQAVFVRHALTLGGIAAPVLRVLMIATGVISFPVGKLLDWLVGHKQSVFYRRPELREFIRLQVDEKSSSSSSSSPSEYSPRSSHRADEASGRNSYLAMASSNPRTAPAAAAGASLSPVRRDSSSAAFQGAIARRSSLATGSSSSSGSSGDVGLTGPEMRIMIGALSLSESTVVDIMKVRLPDVFSISIDDVMSRHLVNKIFESGFSRIAVYDGRRDNITHFLIAKTLILLIYRDESDAPTVRDLSLRRPIFTSPSGPLNDLYISFLRGDAHMAVVRDDNGDALGITTVEDLMEHLHQASFLDETDEDTGKAMQRFVRTRCAGGTGVAAGAPAGDEASALALSGSPRMIPVSSFREMFTESANPRRAAATRPAIQTGGISKLVGSPAVAPPPSRKGTRATVSFENREPESPKQQQRRSTGTVSPAPERSRR